MIMSPNEYQGTVMKMSEQMSEHRFRLRLVSSGNKPLPEHMVTQFYVTPYVIS